MLEHDVGSYTRRRVKLLVKVLTFRNDFQDVWVFLASFHGLDFGIDEILVNILIQYFDCELFREILVSFLPLLHLVLHVSVPGAFRPLEVVLAVFCLLCAILVEPGLINVALFAQLYLTGAAAADRSQKRILSEA